MYRNRGIPSYAAKYKNTDVNSGTVQSLLRTINSMSQRCKSLDATEDILQRIRSIIVLYRPYLIDRHDLQVPELIIEALASPRHHDQPMHSQITHNYNYKYDYNSNVPLANSVDAFGTPVRNNMAHDSATICRRHRRLYK
uniref:Orf417 n=1 Tax=Helicoverpa zea single nucleopolyhedrovirus TaxID=10468 RepID=Q82481_9ABAC|nr:orf417 [Helicoverpa zea single nucleopolyhedrovirus]